ncbi:helix-turn-helix transcriptional regulator [Actinomycetospora aeridis]|uniref:Helix-turn-helix transcriptional regulator n=1 Tax=Actinomycetospora aeridis TaxID=3129231 RepID=A0ABU8N7R9_9PSEU
MTEVLVPVHRHHITTDDPDVAAAHQAAYGRFRHEPVPREGFAFGLDAAFAGPLGISRLRHTARFRARVDPLDGVVVVEVVGGGVRVATTGHDTSGPVMLAPHWSPHTVRWEGVDLRLTTLDQAEVGRVGAEVSGLDPTAVVFGSMTPRSPALARYWSELVDHVDRALLPDDELMSSPLVRGEALRQLAVGVLLVFPNSTLGDRQAEGPGTAQPATIRRAVAFMDAHAQEDITLGQIAAAARIGPRGLQAAFRRHREQSPLDYLRRTRMERAHDDLRSGDPTRGDTVGIIAARWGFANAGRFAVEYRQRYGCSPRETLRR